MKNGLAMCRYDDGKRHAHATQMAMRFLRSWDNICLQQLLRIPKVKKRNRRLRHIANAPIEEPTGTQSSTCAAIAFGITGTQHCKGGRSAGVRASELGAGRSK